MASIQSPLTILGIESSCDETAAAVVRATADYDRPNGTILANVVVSQLELHASYGGVVPELASRAHIRHLYPVIRQAMSQAGVQFQELDGVAVTAGPGLAGALLAGIAVAKGVALAVGKPLIGVHHMEGHLMSPFLGQQPLHFPFIALLVSGGHTLLLLVRRFGDYQLLGRSRDDSVGEAFDKGARLLGLGYPGGPALSLAAQGGDPQAFHLPQVLLQREQFDFSFSGLKTALRLLIERQANLLEDPLQRRHLAACYQQALVTPLVIKSIAACQQLAIPRLVVAGGVGANQQLRQLLQQQAQQRQIELLFPALSLCTDNAAMIALAGLLRLAGGQSATMELNARARWPIETFVQHG
ncbi:MAG: tRNA (adenosine(37)-N6)-threonylcarbamoyltransferase complex transferase subunit TsaD [Magnetococcales bacterium]|nr:tRNA (adenosine(37)-N6)-threonylcarbamoyltransferase complex transferase subunit TsaD [Magnetococcales bacterium]